MPYERKEKKNRKKGERKEETSVEGSTGEDFGDTPPAEIPRKKHKKCKDNKSNSDSEVSEQDKKVQHSGSSAGAEKASKKRKHMAATNISAIENDTEANTNVTTDSMSKRMKKEKQKSYDESSLGVVDHSILQQAGTNLGLPVEEQENASNATPKEKKKKKKKEQKLVSVQEDNAAQQEGTRWNRCLDYLRLWATNRGGWRFKKASQIQLLQIMYSKSQMGDEDFALMLQYLEEIRGKARDKTREDAEKLLQDDSDPQETQDPDKVERARQIFQLLS